MKKHTVSVISAILCLVGIGANAQSMAHLEKHGASTQLIVDGKPFLVLGGELANTASSSAEYMTPVWPRLASMHLNTVLTGVSWAQFEPEEGKYDFALIDNLLADARAENLRIVFVWFGSWKNGISSFAPAWVKENQARFPRAQLGSGRGVEVLSTLSDANLNADAKAYRTLMGHLRMVDGEKHTVIMIQVENEVGLLGAARDRSEVADDAFKKPVPQGLMNYLQTHRTTLRPELKSSWDVNGDRTVGSWAEVFGNGMADEIFMAWHYARYMNEVTKAGKAEYPVPVFTNTWIVQPEDRGPGDYPSGCPEPQVLDIWRAGAPEIDMNAPDIYLPNFTEWVAKFHQNGNPLFVPESRGDEIGVANAFYAIGQESAIGYSPFGIDTVSRFSPDALRGKTSDEVVVNDLPLTKGYEVLSQLAPIILEHQGTKTIGAVSLTSEQLNQTIVVGDYSVRISRIQNRRSNAVGSISTNADPAYAMIIQTGRNEYFVAGSNAEVTFEPNTAGPPIAGLAQVQAGHFLNQSWVLGRWLNGDDILLDYKLAEAAAVNQSGSGLRFASGGPTILKIVLYRYQ